ncbi:MAG UNVERIFIED_CONTAM: hypothetical protein LVT10_05185 [Anaerolineae bacterium]
MAFPGRVSTLPTASTDESFRAIADTLLDIETSYYTPDAEWMPYLERSGSPCTKLPIKRRIGLRQTDLTLTLWRRLWLERC